MNKSIILIAYFNEKAFGIRYIAHELKKNGYDVHLVFFKKNNPYKPARVSEQEISLLEKLIERINPSYIGMSVMSCLYMETVIRISERIKKIFSAPIIWGGVYATLMNDDLLSYCDYVIRGEGEKALIELLHNLDQGLNIDDIKNLVFKKGDKIIKNDVRELIQNLDGLGYPKIGSNNIYFIEKDILLKGDPQLKTYTYEMITSRGCPFACSFCSSINLKRMYVGKGDFIRTRSVKSVMQELLEAKKILNLIKEIIFGDDIFPSDINWIEDFACRYKKEIDIPFRIWGHPLKVNEAVISKLVDAGLREIAIGFQSGSLRIRKQIFHRKEDQEQIIQASKILSKCKVPNVIYDLMILHPFESQEELKESFYLILELEPPFELQLHGLHFLPGTDIIDLALKKGVLSQEDLFNIIHSSTQQQYNQYWGAGLRKEHNIWAQLIFLAQFPFLRSIVMKMARNAEKQQKNKLALFLYKIMNIIGSLKKNFIRIKLILRIFQKNPIQFLKRQAFFK